MYSENYRPRERGAGLMMAVAVALLLATAQVLVKREERRQAFTRWMNGQMDNPTTPATMLDQVPDHLAAVAGGGKR
jgi:hypothetical protein